MGPPRDREPLVHWCHGAAGGAQQTACNRIGACSCRRLCKVHRVAGACRRLHCRGLGGHLRAQRPPPPLSPAGAVFLFCQASESLGPQTGAPFLAAALRAGQAVWDRGLLKKGPGLCHGVSGSAYALLRLYKATGDTRRAHTAAGRKGKLSVVHGNPTAPVQPASQHQCPCF